MRNTTVTKRLQFQYNQVYCNHHGRSQLESCAVSSDQTVDLYAAFLNAFFKLHVAQQRAAAKVEWLLVHSSCREKVPLDALLTGEEGVHVTDAWPTLVHRISHDALRSSYSAPHVPCIGT